MIRNITFLHTNWIVYLSIGSMIIWFLFVWKEWRHVGTPRFWINITIAFLAIGCLVLIALKPARSILSKKTKVAILTSGYDSKQLDSLKKAHKPLQTFPYKANRPILSNINTSDSVFLLGHGIEPFDFWQLANYKIHYLKGNTPSGIVRFTYDYKKTVGEQFRFRGLYNTPKKGNQLILQGPGGNSLDSIMMVSGIEQSFQLSASLKSAGRYTFSLLEKDSLGTILSRNPIPIIAKNRTSLKILLVNSFPTFETKYLKNYLAEMGHQVLVKSSITKGKYKFEYFNMDRIPMSTFTKDNLEPFDLVILDADTQKNLGDRSRTALENAIREDGVGLFIQPNNDFFRSAKGIVDVSFLNQKSTETTLSTEPTIKMSTYPFIFKDQFQTQAIHKNNSKQIISAYQHLGKGRVGTTTLERTYEILLKGNTRQYQQIWAALISRISKKNVTDVSWRNNQRLAVKDQPYQFTMSTSITAPEVQTKEGYQIAMRQDIDLPTIWIGTTYPKELGWNTITVSQDTTAVLEYFVTDTTTWKSSNRYQKIKKNSRFFYNNVRAETEQRSPVAPINPIGLFVFFLVCMGYLWLVPKLGKE
ncbi:hypothetical protein ACWGOQ_0009815 [Aquimarina sp. M1]